MRVYQVSFNSGRRDVDGAVLWFTIFITASSQRNARAALKVAYPQAKKFTFNDLGPA